METRQVNFLPTAWNDAARAELKRSCRWLLSGPSDYERGGNRLFEVVADGAHVGWLVLGFESYEKGTAGVVVAAVGALQGVDLIRALEPAMAGMFSGVKVLRTYTTRAGLIRKLKSCGWTPGQTIMEKVLA